MEKDTDYMRLALREAEKAYYGDEIPVGAVIVCQNRIIGRAHNQIKLLKDPTAHAEILAITQAAAALENERLTGAAIYVTIEPCPMCVGALILARVDRLIYGASDPKTGACGSVMNIPANKSLNHRVKITKGILEKECASLIKHFFAGKRGQATL